MGGGIVDAASGVAAAAWRRLAAALAGVSSWHHGGGAPASHLEISGDTAALSRKYSLRRYQPLSAYRWQSAAASESGVSAAVAISEENRLRKASAQLLSAAQLPGSYGRRPSSEAAAFSGSAMTLGGQPTRLAGDCGEILYEINGLAAVAADVAVAYQRRRLRRQSWPAYEGRCRHNQPQPGWRERR